MSAKPGLSKRVERAETTLVMSSVVILARDVNQSIFTTLWLVKNGILLEEEASVRDLVVAAGITRVPTPEFELLVLPDRLQMRFDPKTPDATGTLNRVLGGIAKTLPHTPFSAVGLNFQHELVPTGPADFFEWNRRIFASPWALTRVNDDTRTRFGCNFAYDAYDGARMRVSAGVKSQADTSTDRASSAPTHEPYVVVVSCNLHRDLSADNAPKELPRMLGLWRSVRDDTTELVASLRS